MLYFVIKKTPIGRLRNRQPWRRSSMIFLRLQGIWIYFHTTTRCCKLHDKDTQKLSMQSRISGRSEFQTWKQRRSDSNRSLERRATQINFVPVLVTCSPQLLSKRRGMRNYDKNVTNLSLRISVFTIQRRSFEKSTLKWNTNRSRWTVCKNRSKRT